MTEYGRGPGSEPWHPEDPLYGDQGWEGGRQAAHGQGQYDSQQQPYAQDPYAQQQPQQGYPQDPYTQQQAPYAQQQQQHQHDPYAQQHQQDPYAQQHQQDPYAQQPQYGAPQDPYAQQPQQQYNGGWDTGQQAAMPYEPQPQPPYGNAQGGYGEQADYYGTPEAYPPPQPPGHREQAPEPQQHAQPQQPQRQNPDWDPDVPQEETHPFFTGADDPADDRDSRDGRDLRDDEYDDDPRESRRGGGERRGKGKKKSRNGCACLGVAAVLVGGLGGVVYFGYSYYQSQFGEAPDYAGGGSGSVEVEIPKGAFGNEIASILKKAGVVKSADAFISAQNGNPKGKSIQAGVYLLKQEMSADNALKMMLDPKSQNALVIPEGTSTGGIYELIDKRLELKEGTTAEVAKTKAESLGLPEWADDDPKIKDPLEGFLFPAAYPVSKGGKPEDTLKRMVSRANEEYGKLDLEKNAERLKLKSPLELITVASLVQKEGKYKHDFDKVARVVYNRLEPDNLETVGRLEFDSTINYIRAESTLDLGPVDGLRKIDDPYNTYKIKGLPLGPISNPGTDALNSAINPASGPWYYFVSVTEDKTVFAVTNEEHERNRREYEEQQAGQ
ncbi:endolytic transglycosylase MltG [Streptomyces sp. NBC_01102]|uniref:endolytic transglycosylase MltG n=1 Tax=unclassified Streptomyces TaxID=2593676 RepID=UPI00387062B4|nr:endolytic transglycosylase MltG [Streptomyces sp. NBC_01102]